MKHLLVSLPVKKLRAIWQSLWVDVDRRVRLGRVLGMVFVTAGFVLMGLAWNGAASKNLIQSQFPYLLSGGVMGLGLVILGGTLWMLSTIRGERQILTDKVDEMIQLLARNLARTGATVTDPSIPGGTEQVVATNRAYHLPGCRILEGKTNVTTLTVAQALAEGLAACRVCSPPSPPKEEPVDGSEAPAGDAASDVTEAEPGAAEKEKETA